MSDVLVKCENLGKKFCRDLKQSLWYGVRDSLTAIRSRRSDSSSAGEGHLRPGEFWANRDINFEVRRGECLGLIGRNGAGKTTLLKMINGLLKPNEGSIELRGKISGLIALGAGFNPILTGRENIQVNGSILGLSQRQISDRIEQIVSFAELSHAIDAPVRTYSSGMQVRLGFSVAINLIQPDVLLLDEVLAVGDIGFTVKCLNAMRDLTNRSAAIFVTHSMQYVTLFCSHAMMMEGGKSVKYSGDVASVIDRYHSAFTLDECRSGSGEARISDIKLHSEIADVDSAAHIAVPHGSRLTMELSIETTKTSFLRAAVRTQNLFPLIDSAILDQSADQFLLQPGHHTVQIDMGTVDYNAGLYPVVVGIFDADTHKVLERLESGASIRVIKSDIDYGFISRNFRVISNAAAVS